MVKHDTKRLAQTNLINSRILKANKFDMLRELDELCDDIERDYNEFLDQRKKLAVKAARQGYEVGVKQVLDNIADVEGEIKRQHLAKLQNLTPELTDILIAVLREILGNFDQRDLISRVLGVHLLRLEALDTLKFIASPETALIVEAALKDASKQNELKYTVDADNRLKAGQIMLETNEGYFDLGIGEQIKTSRSLISKNVASILSET